MAELLKLGEFLDRKKCTLPFVGFVLGRVYAPETLSTETMYVAPSHKEKITDSYSVTTDMSQITEATSSDFVWRIEPAPTYEETMPRQNLSLTYKEQTYMFGEKISCNESGTGDWETNVDKNLTNKSTSSVTCYFAGGGDKFAVFKEDGKVVLKRLILEEGSPEVDVPEFQYETILVLGDTK